MHTANHYYNRFSQELNKLVETLEHRLLPTFGSLSAEADQIKQDAMQSYNGSLEAQECLDPMSAYEGAMEAAHEHYDIMFDLKQGLINMFAAALYHLFEQQVREMHVRVLGHAPLNYEKGVLEDWDRSLGACPLTETMQNELAELRDLANTIKHGDGKAAASLYERNPTLLQDQWDREFALEEPSVKVAKPE